MNKNTAYVLSILFLLLPQVIFALPADENKKMKITAEDGVVMNRKTGENIFTGNVIIDQGTTHVTADKVITHANKKKQLTEIIAFGTKQHLAHYQTLPKPRENIFDAWAVTIKYYPQKRLAILIDNAIAEQKPNRFTGPKITYDLNKQFVQSYAQKNHRSTIILYPNKLPK